MLGGNLVSLLYGDVSVMDSLVESQNYSIFYLAFIASSFRVTEENLVFETAHTLLLNVFSAL